MAMQALVLKKKHELIMETRRIPEPEINEVLIQTAYVGICGSDIHYWQEGEIGDFKLNKPMIMGHETSGVVVKVGQNLVNHLNIGDRVCIEPGIPCRSCVMCKTGKYNLCPEIKFHATPPYDGTLSNYFVHPSDFCYKLPDAMSLELGALVEPMAVATFALQRARMTYGKTVFVSGAGPIGLCCLIAAMQMGASQVYITDVVENRLKTAKILGANHTLHIIPTAKVAAPNTHQANVLLTQTSTSLNSTKPLTNGTLKNGIDTATCVPADSSKNVDQTTNIVEYFREHGMPDITLEATGTASGIDLALQVTKPGGKLVCIGFSFNPTTIKFFNVLAKQIDILGIFRYANCFPQTIELLENCPDKDKIQKAMITHVFDFEGQAVKAYEVAKDNGIHNAIKVMIKMPGIP